LGTNYTADGGWILTPAGPGKFVAFDPTTGNVTVEMDCAYLVEFPGDKCLVYKKKEELCE
jgi:hypothetical protein